MHESPKTAPSDNAPAPADVKSKPGIHRRLYDWILSWAESRWGTVALFVLSFAESSFFPIPPDPLLIALALGNRLRSFFYAFICSLSSVLGGIAGYLIGAFLWHQMADLFFTYVFSESAFNDVQVLYEKYNFWVVFTAGFTPVPYKIITITGGVFGINFLVFLTASVISRSARFFLVAGLIRLYGEPVKNFIDRYFNLLSVLFVLLLVLGFFIINYAL